MSPSRRPPRRRDTQGIPDLIRQAKTNLRTAGGVGFLDGRSDLPRPPGSLPIFGDGEDSSAVDQEFPRFWNTDGTTAAADDTAVAFTLTHEPVDGSLHVRKNGLDLTPSEWTLDGQTLTVTPAAELVVRAGDVFSAAYAYYPGEAADIVVPSLVGVTTVSGPTSSIALPAGTEAGDLLVLANCGWATPGDCTDPRMSLHDTFPGQFVDLGRVWTGTADASGDPIPVSTDAIRNAALLATYRGGTLVGSASSNDTAPASSAATAPQMPYSLFTASIAMLRLGGFTTGTISRSGAYTVDGSVNDDAKVAVSFSHWAVDDEVAALSPADAYTFTGSIDGWALLTLKIGLGL